MTLFHDGRDDMTILLSLPCYAFLRSQTVQRDAGVCVYLYLLFIYSQKNAMGPLNSVLCVCLWMWRVERSDSCIHSASMRRVQGKWTRRLRVLSCDHFFFFVLFFFLGGEAPVQKVTRTTCNNNKHVVASTQEQYEVISNGSACNHTRGCSKRVRDRKRRGKRKRDSGIRESYRYLWFKTLGEKEG